MNAPLTRQQITSADTYSRALAGTTLPQSLRAQLATLDDAQIVELLGEILDASIASPFRTSDELYDALMPVSAAYRAAYDTLAVQS